MTLINAKALDRQIAKKLKTIEGAGLIRRRFGPPTQPACINFSSNDYLGLTKDSRLRKAYQEGFDLYPCGSGASPVVSGYYPSHQALEGAFAEALSADEALLFSSGYAANLALTMMLASLDAHLLIDKRIHASIYDGIALSKVSVTRFPHQNVSRMKSLLKAGIQRPILLTEGIFSMSGEIAPLDQIMTVCHQASDQVYCIVDEAHSFGVIGPHGLGATAHYSLTQQDIPLRVIPFGKALAGQGAVVLGRRDWIQLLLQQGRSAIYSTAISPAIAHGLKTALSLCYAADDKRHKLQELVQYFQQGTQQSLLRWRQSSTPIQQLQCGCPHLAQKLEQFLFNEGFLCRAIRQPTVPRNETGLRIVLNHCHEWEDIDKLFERIHTFFRMNNGF